MPRSVTSSWRLRDHCPMPGDFHLQPGVATHRGRSQARVVRAAQEIGDQVNEVDLDASLREIERHGGIITKAGR